MTSVSMKQGEMYENYIRSNERSKPRIKDLVSQILKNTVDTTEALTDAHRHLNSPEHQMINPTLRLDDRLSTWYRDFETENLNYRRKISRLMDSLQTIVGGLPQSQKLYNEIGMIKHRKLNDSEMKAGFRKNYGDYAKLNDAVKIVDGPSTSVSPIVGSRKMSFTNLGTGTPVRRRSIDRRNSNSRIIRNPSINRLQSGSKPGMIRNGQNLAPAAPKYYRIDERGNRIPIEKPGYNDKSPLGARKRSISPMQGRPSTGQLRRPLSSINSINQSKPIYSPMNQNGSVKYLTPSRVQGNSQISRPPSAMASPSPFRHGTSPTPVGEKRIYFNDPKTGNRMIKVTTPRGNNILRIEPCEPRKSFQPQQRSASKITDKGITPQTNPHLNPQIRRMVDDAKSDFSDPVIEDFDVSDYPCKIECNHNGSKIYYGADSLGELTRRNKWLENVGSTLDLQISTLKSLPNGDLICNDLRNWDLVLLDSNYNEKKRVAGNGVELPRYYRFMKTRVSEDDRYIIWVRGPSEISIVDTRDFSARHIHNFWNFRGENSKGTVVAIDPTASKIVGIGFIENPRGYQTMHVYDGTDGVTAFEASDVIPEVKAWLCLETSVDGDVFFVGGAEKRNFESGSAYLAALSFDENAELINFSKFDNGFSCINSLRRHPDGNVIFAGCKGHLAIILWVHKEFHLITQLKNVVSNPISDICFNNNVIYTVCDYEKGRAFYFDDTLIKGRGQNPSGTIRPGSTGPGYSQSTMAQKYLNREKIPPKFQSLFRDYRIKQIAIPGAELQRIQVTSDQRYIYTGKNDLKVLELRGDRYTLLNVGDHVNRFIDIKLLDNDELIVFEEDTSDLVKYDRNLREIERLRGKKKINLRGAEIVTSLYSGDHHTYIWMPGDNSIGLVNPKTMEHDIIANFFGPSSDESIPFTVIASHKEKKVLGLYITSRTQEMNFVFLRSGNGFIRKSQLEILGEEGTILCLESSLDENILFAGGGTQLQLNQGIAKIFALTFDEDIEYINDLILPSSKMNTMGVSDIKRMTDCDVLFVGTKMNLFVVEWTGSHFVILNHIEDIHSWLLNSIDSVGATCFTVSKEDDHINKITFSQ